MDRVNPPNQNKRHISLAPFEIKHTSLIVSRHFYRPKRAQKTTETLCLRLIDNRNKRNKARKKALFGIDAAVKSFLYRFSGKKTFLFGYTENKFRAKIRKKKRGSLSFLKLIKKRVNMVFAMKP
uniref:Uncharacterized protein n=1 Tax=Salix viminalis TaxID=40686 RepID=A0A6N2LV96_SALVM